MSKEEKDDYNYQKRVRFKKRIILICVVAVFLILNTVFIVVAVRCGSEAASGRSNFYYNLCCYNYYDALNSYINIQNKNIVAAYNTWQF